MAAMDVAPARAAPTYSKHSASETGQLQRENIIISYCNCTMKFVLPTYIQSVVKLKFVHSVLVCPC
jgi:hypothetical protein